LESENVKGTWEGYCDIQKEAVKRSSVEAYKRGYMNRHRGETEL